MGTVVRYSLEVAVLLAAFYCVYRVALARCTFFRFNRVALLGGYAVALLAFPMWGLWQGLGDAAVPEVSLEEVMEEVSSLERIPAPRWPMVVSLVYLAGVGLAACLTLVSVFRIRSIICNGEKVLKDGYVVVYTGQRSVPPFSWGRYIVLPAGLDPENRHIIELHELAHVRRLHWLDLALGQAVIVLNWFNPAAYLMMRELQNVHEFEADAAVLASGVDDRRYQMMLIGSSMSPRFPAAVDSFSCVRLKARLRLMGAPASNPRRKIALVLSGLLMFAGAVAVEGGVPGRLMASVSRVTLLIHEYDQVEYFNDGATASVSYLYEGEPSVVSMDIPPGSDPEFYINRRLASAADLRTLKAEDVVFIIADNVHNRFVVRTR